VPRLRDALRSPFDRLDGRVLVVDLTAVRFLGSPGLRALAEGATEAARHRGVEPLRVVVDHNRPVIGPLEIVGLDGVLAPYHDVGAALGDDAPTS
jgi:anti-sigma B factor antagonist